VFGFPVDGIVGPLTWSLLITGENPQPLSSDHWQDAGALSALARPGVNWFPRCARSGRPRNGRSPNSNPKFRIHCARWSWTSTRPWPDGRSRIGSRRTWKSKGPL